MPRATFLRASTALAALLTAQAAAADVTPADVWANTQAYLGSFGATATADLVQSGDVTELENFAARFQLPMGYGTIDARATGLSLQDLGDGTVRFRYADGAALSLSVDLSGQGSGEMSAVIVGAFDMVASGAPGDVTYSYDVPEYSVEITGLDISDPAAEAADLEMLRGADVSGRFTVRGTVGQMQITEGALVTTTLDARYGEVDYDVRVDAGDGNGITQTGAVGASTTTASVAMPAGGADVMALSPALESGMAFDFSSSSASTRSDQEVRAAGNVVGYTRDESGPGSASLRLDTDGLVLAGKVSGYSFDQLDPVLPLPIKGLLESAEARIALPAVAGDAPQGFAFLMDLGGLALDETLWGLFDPAQSLPRDPISLRLDLDGQMGTSVGLLDVPALMGLAQSGENPLSIHAATLRQLALSAVGASVTGAGDFTFDMSDLATFNGVPAPTGALDVEVQGANRLIDTLIEMGAVPQDQALGARMMMGLFAQPGEGEDSLVSRIEIDGAAGSISANGQRLR